MKALGQIHRYNPDRPFRPWLLKIVGNEARNRKRSEGRRLHYEMRAAARRDIPPASDHPDEVAARTDSDAALLAAVNRLPEKERLVVGLRYFLDLSEKETARAAAIPLGTVKSRLSRAMRRLRQDLGDLDV